MKIFISWSGERSRQVADLLNWWIQCVLQNAKPWVSTSGIDKGTKWFTEITTQLADCSVGIICLTKDNLIKPWILFEAGAIAKGLDNRVLTLLIDLKHNDIEDPLAQFNHTLPTKQDMRKFVGSLNTYLGEQKLEQTILDRTFENNWTGFESDFNRILKDTPAGEATVKRDQASVIDEILSTVRGLEKKIYNLDATKAQKVIRVNPLTNQSEMEFELHKGMKTRIERQIKEGYTHDMIVGYYKLNGYPLDLVEDFYNELIPAPQKD